MPITAKVDVRQGDKIVTVSAARLRREGHEGQVQADVERRRSDEGQGGYHGIVLVPNVVERTPPYVEEVPPGSPAAKAGLKPDDLIVYVDGEPVVSIAAFKEMHGQLRPGHGGQAGGPPRRQAVPIDAGTPKRK